MHQTKAKLARALNHNLYYPLALHLTAICHPLFFYSATLHTHSCLGMHLFGGKFCTRELLPGELTPQTSPSAPPTTTNHNPDHPNGTSHAHDPQARHHLHNHHHRRFARELHPQPINPYTMTTSGTTTMLVGGEHRVPCTCEDLRSPHITCACNRKNFNNFLWATMTVFQVTPKFFLLNTCKTRDSTFNARVT